MTNYFLAAAHETFSPPELLEQAVAAEAAGFDGVVCSDHYQPWFEPGHSGQAWVWLGAAAQATDQVKIGTAVTAPVYRYHPAIVAQMAATLETLAPGRTVIGLGSGESLNESPVGMDWPEPGDQLSRLEEALQIIRRLLGGERVDHSGPHFRTKNAYLHTLPPNIPPLFVSAFGPQAAELAARYGDGLWTMGDPEMVGEVLPVYEKAASHRGEVLMHVGFSWAADDQAALDSARPWKATLVPEFFSDDWHDPRAMELEAKERISDDEVVEGLIVGSDPATHIERIRATEDLGATTVVLMNVSAHAPLEAIDVYGKEILPELRST